MKKVIYLIIPLILLSCINACSGYKPIFGSSNLQFEIADYVIEGNKKLGNEIYSKLYNLSNSYCCFFVSSLTFSPSNLNNCVITIGF